MDPLTKFEVTNPNDGPSNNVSAIMNTISPRGQAVGMHPNNAANEFWLAGHNNFVGFLTRDVTLLGLSTEERLLGERLSDTPVGFEAPVKVGGYASARMAYEVECEGADYIWLSGTGAISTSTPVPSSISYYLGRARISQSGEKVNATLAANNLDPSEAGALRIRLRIV